MCWLRFECFLLLLLLLLPLLLLLAGMGIPVS
jgi:hypothetical protein